MGYVIIRQHPDTDEYVIWDNGSDMPVAVGTRDEIAHDAGELEPDRTDLEARLAHTDLYGSSMAAPGRTLGHWDDEGLIYRQTGFLPRELLFVAACRLIVEDDEEAVAFMLEPFDD